MIKNLDRINIIKREMVKKSAEIASKCPYIDRIVVFGSSVRNDCRENSDIDFVFFPSAYYKEHKLEYIRTLERITEVCEYNTDMLRADMLTDNMMNHVMETGVTVYEG